MHDPMAVAHEIKYPWHRHKPWPKGARRWEDLTAVQQRGRDSFWRDGYRDSFITIWHVDPERDGTDDSCGWFSPKLTEDQVRILKSLAWSEAREPILQRARCKKLLDGSEAEMLARAGLMFTARALDLRLSLEEATTLAIHLVYCNDNNIRGSLCHLPGYHTNFKEDTPEQREYCAMQLFCCFARAILRLRRHWWQHPKWHFFHWKAQVHPWQKFKRWICPEKIQSEAMFVPPEA